MLFSLGQVGEGIMLFSLGQVLGLPCNPAESIRKASLLPSRASCGRKYCLEIILFQRRTQETLLLSDYNATIAVHLGF